MAERSSPPASVDRLQRWMFEVIRHPGGLEAGLAASGAGTDELARMVLPSDTLSAFERLEIYADMYFWRLVDILVEEYPTVRRILGPEGFEATCRAFLVDHPSASYQLNRLSEPFPEWLAGRPEADGPHRDFAADVARVERAMEDVFDDPAVEPVAPDAVAALAPEAWGDAHLEIIPAHRRLALGHPVNAYITAVAEARHVDIPEPAPTATLVWRQGWRTWRKDQHPAQDATLGALAEGRTLGEAVQAAAADLPGVDPQWLISSLGRWFEEWAADGLFSAIRG